MAQNKRVIALGFFDGIHKGHQKLIECAVVRAKEQGVISSVFTFDVHPKTYITGEPIPLIITPSIRKQEIKRLSGVDEVMVVHFDEQMRTMPWQNFIKDVLVGQYGMVHLVSGSNNRIGYQGQGTKEKVRDYCAELGIGYDCIEDVKIDGIVVSSTYIRSEIAQGHLERAEQFLGRPYTITGEVLKGQQIGRKIGYRTVNISLPKHMQWPPFGVYASHVTFGENRFEAVTNIGIRPTFYESGEPVIEAHILGKIEETYGTFAQIELHKMLRQEKTFDSVLELTKAIENDCKQAQKYLRERC